MGSHKKDKKKRKRSTSSSSSRSSASNDFDKKLREERRAKKRVKKEDKARRKEHETAEEKRARRLAKKQRKEEKRKAKESALPETINYTNTNNPFNDMNLTKTFVWGKKLEQEGKTNYTLKDVERENQERIRKNLRHMEELKRTREARQSAKEDMEMMQRDEDRKAHSEWAEKESAFQIQQSKVRSRLRIEQNRAKPIDFLARYINYGEREDDDNFDLEEPSTYLKGLTVDDYEDVLEDINVYKTVTVPEYIGWWNDMAEIARSELNKLKETKKTAIPQSVQDSITQIFKGKSLNDLIDLERSVVHKMSAGSGDISFWTGLLPQLRTHIARTRVKQQHKEKLDAKLQQIREEQMKEMGEKGGEERQPMKNEDIIQRIRVIPLDKLEDPELEDEQKEDRWKQLSDEELTRVTKELYARGAYSPTYVPEGENMPGIEILNEDTDKTNLTKRRKMTRKPDTAAELTPEEVVMRNLAKESMPDEDEEFSVEHPLETIKGLWSEKYRPRKPRYLNRVQTGFDWNKYNQTHYDMDNPPPKIVQGYKFNIFYSDLLDPNETPTFTVTQCDDPDFCILKFHAGPPYEDIAFKCVNREWEVNHKFGYKCQFQNGVFQLWFSFKKYRYRR